MEKGNKQFEFVKTVEAVDPSIYKLFANWTIGEFDLFLMIETTNLLKVYFPNGWFSIRNIENGKLGFGLEIQIKGKSKPACQKIIKELDSIYSHVLRFLGYTTNLGFLRQEKREEKLTFINNVDTNLNNCFAF